jgi:hypothetical protein
MQILRLLAAKVPALDMANDLDISHWVYLLCITELAYGTMSRQMTYDGGNTSHRLFAWEWSSSTYRKASYGTVPRQMAHDRAITSMDYFALRWSFLSSRVISYGLESDMAYDGSGLSQRFILHCDGVEMVRKDVSFGSRSYQAGNKGFSFVIRHEAIHSGNQLSSTQAFPAIKSICWIIRCAAHAMHIW